MVSPWPLGSDLVRTHARALLGRSASRKPIISASASAQGSIILSSSHPRSKQTLSPTTVGMLYCLFMVETRPSLTTHSQSQTCLFGKRLQYRITRALCKVAKIILYRWHRPLIQARRLENLKKHHGLKVCHRTHRNNYGEAWSSNLRRQRCPATSERSHVTPRIRS